jgi:hypothetical protein
LTCGVEGFGVGMQANVVDTIRYEIRDLAADLPGTAPCARASAPGDENRYELRGGVDSTAPSRKGWHARADRGVRR